MYSHHTIGANDLDAAKAFYDAIFTAIGGQEAVVDAKGRLLYMYNGGMFMVTKPINGEPANPANGNTIGIAMDSPEQCAAWHAAGVAAGGTTCEDPPGVRDMGHSKLYLAYLRDPTGHKLCALHRMA
jgi:catechol 2,3-dioxygenase-like lactoylglutathione lyase family enzyme